MHSSAPPQIPGQIIPAQDAAILKQEVANLIERDNLRFPGAQPVSFAREHIAELQRQEYFLCEKTDGVRCLLFLHYIEGSGPSGFDPVTILIDRKNNYYHVEPPLRFPHYMFPADGDKYLFNTLLDGELVHDTVPGQPKPRLIFYVFDCLAIDGKNMTTRPLDKRIGHLKDMVFKPYYAWMQRTHGMPMGPEPFRVKEKQSYPPYSLKEMFNTVLPGLPHGNDGLVFTCKRTPYIFGTDRNILKWKPPHENTIDFKLKIGDFPLVVDPEDGGEPYPDYDAMPESFSLDVMVGNGVYQRFAELKVTPQEWEMLKGLGQYLDGRIIECYRLDSGQWCFKKEDDGTPRWRDDKKEANHISTVTSVLESIEDPVTEQDLLAASPNIRAAVRRLREEEKAQHQQQMQHQQAEHEAKKRKFV